MFQKGDRIRVVSMPDDPDPLPAGATGTVRYANTVRDPRGDFVQYDVAWDAPHERRGIMPIVPPDILTYADQ